MTTGKALTVVELDVDIYRLTQFETERVGVAPSRFTSQWGPNATVDIVTDDAMPTGKALALENTGAQDLIAWQWTRPPAMSQAEVRALFRVPSQGSPEVFGTPGIVVRGSGAESTEGGYLVAFIGDGTEIGIYKIVGGTPTELATADFAWDVEQSLWLLVNIVDIAGGASIRVKAWKGELAAAPSLFSFSYDDTASAITTAGWCGPTIGVAGELVHVGHFMARSLFKTQVETLRYAMPTDYLPADLNAQADIQSVSLSPGTVAIGESMGTRGRLTVQFKDHPSADDGEGFRRGTYWGKFRARYPHLENSAIRLKRGLLSQAFADWETKHYIVQSFDGPTPGGAFAVTAQDPLKLADGDRAQCPMLSNGFLVSGINSSTTSATLAPAGIGDAEYAASGYVALGGKEICAFTRAGDALTLTRGQFGTSAQDHSADDRVQQCTYYNAAKASAILADLLTTYAGVPSSFIPSAAWEVEDDNFLQLLYTRVIAEPTRLDTLINQLIQQAGLSIAWDDEQQQILFQVLRGITLDAETIDEGEILQGTLKTKEQPDSRISQVWVSYGVLNPLEPLDDPNNYRSTRATVDGEAEANYGASRIKKIYAPWVPSFAAQTAERIGDLHLGRFVRPPRKINFDLWRPGARDVQLLRGYRVRWDSNQDEAGNVVSAGAPVQVIRRLTSSDRLSVECEEMLFQSFDAGDLTNRVITIDSNITNVHLPSLHNSIYPPLTDQDVIDGVNLTVVIAANVIVGSASTSAAALDVGTAADWPAGLPITVEINGRAQGKGGNGGIGRGETQGGVNGQAGGPGLFTRVPIAIEFGDAGQVFGGGGGGGGGRTANDGAFTAGGGGGGAGTLPGIGGNSKGTGKAADGTTESGGAGRNTPYGDGGDGGDPGQSGQNGTKNIPFGGAPGVGGAPGAAIDGDSFVTISIGPGDIRGPQIN
ncbi:hypothetical protein [Filomicrobium sp.]|uniref:hypothetical protein n=1 Tax=Filomicrobium sp. TaxID=2024831 RepID=UPI00258F80C8|nr:hypothetical protein [Filomicrobium sp.]MCV0371070.1 hypothetical protein [Filomicrobium sp.]